MAIVISPDSSIQTLAVPKKIGSLTAIGHSFIAGHTQSDSGTSDVYQESMIARICGLLGIHENNVFHMGQGATAISQPVNGLSSSLFGGWAGVLAFCYPNNSASMNSATDTVISDPIVPSNGASFIMHGCNDFMIGTGLNSGNAQRVINNIAAAKQAYRTIISRLRAGVVYCAQTAVGVITWDASIAFAGTWADNSSVTRNSGSAYKSSSDFVTPSKVTITIPSNFTGATIAVCFFGQANGVTQTTAQVVDGTANAAVSTTNTTLTDTRQAWGVNGAVGDVVTCNGKTMTVTSNSSTVLTGASWSGGGNPGNGNAYNTTGIPMQDGTQFPSSGTLVIKMDSEEMLVTAGLAGAGAATWTVTRAVNGSSQAVHAVSAIVSVATDTHKVTWTTSGTNANITGTTFIGGQGTNNNVVPIVKRFVCTSADVGKTIVATSGGLVAGDTSASIQFDSWWIESNDPPPTVVANMHHYEWGTSIITNVANVATWNTMLGQVQAEFDGWVQLANVYNLWFNRNGVLGTTMNSSDATDVITWTANSNTFTPSVGQMFTFGLQVGENVLCTAVTGSYPTWTLTVTRGAGGTAKATHAIGDWLGPADWINTDNTHPNVRGHAIYAEAIYEAFQAMPTPNPVYQIAESQGNWTQNAQSFSMGVIDNSYLYPSATVAAPAAIATIGTQYAHPLYIPKMSIITEMGVFMGTTAMAASGVIRFGIYFPDGSHSRPQRLIQDFGTQAATSTSVAVIKTGLYQVLRPGWYWVSAVQQTGATGGKWDVISGLYFPQIMMTATLGAQAGAAIGFSVTAQTGALVDWNLYNVELPATPVVPRIFVRLRAIQFV